MKKMLVIFTSAAVLLLSGCAYSSDEKPNLSIQDSAPLTQSGESESETPSTSDSPPESTIFESIVNSSDLPQYCGSLKQAKKFGKRFESGIVSFDGYLSFVPDKTILAIEGYLRDDEINGVEFYFKNADVSLNFQEAENVMNLFLPLDVLTEKYSEPQYEIFTPKDKSESEYIAVTYLYNQDVSSASEYELHDTFYIMYELYNDVCLSASVDSRLPRWTTSANANGYFVSEYVPLENPESTSEGR